MGKEEKKRICGIEIVTYIDRTLFVLLGLQYYVPAALHRTS